MENITHKLISLKANVPYPIYVDGGIDCCETIIHFRYPSSANGKKIVISFCDADGRVISTPPLQFERGQTDFQYRGQLGNLDNNNFGSVELLSAEELNLEVWFEKSTVNFF